MVARINAMFVSDSNTKLFDNYYPYVCNGLIDKDRDRSWNPNGWEPKFHIIKKSNDEMKESIRKLAGISEIPVNYFILEGTKTIASGYIIYNIQNGEIKHFKNTGCENDVIKVFLKHVIILFGGMNYIEKMNALKNHINVLITESKPKVGSPTTRNINCEKIYALKDKPQSEFVPKEIKECKTIIKTSHIVNSDNKTSKQKRHYKTRKQIIYTMKEWERHGYYRKDGTYVKPCTCHRHIS